MTTSYFHLTLNVIFRFVIQYDYYQVYLICNIKCLFIVVQISKNKIYKNDL